MATAGWQQDRQASLVLGLRLTVITAVAMHARAIERHKGWDYSQTCRRGGGHATGACRPSIVIEGVQGTTERLIMKLGGDHAGRHEAGGGRRLEEPGDEVERLIDQSPALEPQGFDRFPDGEVAHGRVLLGRLSNDIVPATTFVTHARHGAEVISGLTAVGLFPQFSS